MPDMVTISADTITTGPRGVGDGSYDFILTGFGRPSDICSNPMPEFPVVCQLKSY